MNWIYLNNSNRIICYQLFSWMPGEQHETSFPVPESLGLTCIQNGSIPDVILLHQDIFIQAGEKFVIDIPQPSLSHNVDLAIFNLSPNAPVVCRFNHVDNSPIPLDVRGFKQIINWSLCSMICFLNQSEVQAHISLSVSEVA